MKQMIKKAFLLIILSLLTACYIKPIDTNVNTESIVSVDMTTDEFANKLILKMVDQAPVVMYFTSDLTGTWNNYLSCSDLPEDLSMAEVEVIEQLTSATYEDFLNPDTSRQWYYEVMINHVYWGEAAKNTKLIISSYLEYTPGAKLILHFLNKTDVNFASSNGNEYKMPVMASGVPLFVVEYEGIEYVVDKFHSDLFYELYDRGILKDRCEAVVYKDVTIVSKDLLESLLDLHQEYQTGKWIKFYSWQMDAGAEKESAQSEEEQKIQIIQ